MNTGIEYKKWQIDFRKFVDDIPVGSIVNLWGKQSEGKTFMDIHNIDPNIVYIEHEKYNSGNLRRYFEKSITEYVLMDKKVVLISRHQLHSNCYDTKDSQMFLNMIPFQVAI